MTKTLEKNPGSQPGSNASGRVTEDQKNAMAVIDPAVSGMTLEDIEAALDTAAAVPEDSRVFPFVGTTEDQLQALHLAAIYRVVTGQAKF